MLYTLQNVRDNLRNRDGKRIFYLSPGDTLTPSARDYLTGERIPILPPPKKAEYVLEDGTPLPHKPEDMTHLHSNVLVPKTHPRIAFRGAMDTLEAELLLCAHKEPGVRRDLEQILALTRKILSCEVLSQPLQWQTLCGMTEDEIRSRSHRPQEYYHQPHFMPQPTDTATILRLNRCRTMARHTELMAAKALPDRQDLLQALNRISSMLYLLMITHKAQRS